jgi:maltooligosyltrehalose trehalohydrolase
MDELRLGASLEETGARFRVWTAQPDVRLWVGGKRVETPWTAGDNGVRQLFIEGAGAGTRYGYEIGGQGPFPDVASRFQPEGVHGLSEVVDTAFAWSDGAFRPPAWRDTVFYELHIGSFSALGTWRGAAEKLPYLGDLGVNAIEVMPVASFPGTRNWGYDGVSLYAPSANYGTPAEFRAFVDRAHALGLAVYLDVVFNHLGPDGAYHRLFHPGFYREGTHTPWGEALSFAGVAREFFIESALHWVREYHVDGFRLDATHAIRDDGERHFAAELAARVRQAAQDIGRECRVIAEDDRNQSALLRPESVGGWNLDGLWADDFHHQMRRGLAGDGDGYYADYGGSAEDVATTLREGWFYRGQHSVFHGRARGSRTTGIDAGRFIFCLQNHDQTGNRAQGERLHHQIDLPAYVAASALLLLAPETPLLFMGQEWAASSPFLYFTDHNEELGRLVKEGRRREFARFEQYASEEGQRRIPDPQDEATFMATKLRWEEREEAGRAWVLAWYRKLLAIRREVRRGRCEVVAEGGGILLCWRDEPLRHFAFIAWLSGAVWNGAPESGGSREVFPLLAAEGVTFGGGRCTLPGPGFAILRVKGE